MKLVLFDIDGTLVDTAGAGRRAFSRALADVFGFSDGLAKIRLDGMTDPAIVREVFSRYGIHSESATIPELLLDTYIRYLKEELERGKEGYRVLPGVKALLSKLKGNPGVLLGLASGNVEAGARLKLDGGNLNRFFPLGGFGSDAENRTALIRIAVERAQEYLGTFLDSVFVVGDTPKDIHHGHEAGALVLAVASGSYSLGELEKYGPDMVVQTLSPTEALVRFFQ